MQCRVQDGSVLFVTYRTVSAVRPVDCSLELPPTLKTCCIRYSPGSVPFRRNPIRRNANPNPLPKP